MKALITLAAAAAFAATLSGCNTMAGMGRDVSATGQGVSNVAYNVRSEWREWRHRHDTEYETARSACAGGTEDQREACRDRVRADYRTKMTFRLPGMASSLKERRFTRVTSLALIHLAEVLVRILAAARECLDSELVGRGLTDNSAEISGSAQSPR